MGLSVSEFGALTPREIDIELEVARERERERVKDEEFKLRFLDAHLATLEMLIHNANFKRAARVADYRLLKDKSKRNLSEEVLAFDARLRAKAQAKFRKKQKMKVLICRQ